VDLAIRNTGRQLELVDQLLMLARLDAGQLEFRPRASRLDKFLRQVAASYESLAARQQVQFRCELPEAPVPGRFDEGQLEHIVGNLLGNAFKFTPAAGTVTLRLRLVPDGWAVIQVEDTGPGIAAQDLPHIFERFYRGEPSAGQRPGTGIGLAVAKECVELHGGTIQAENRAEGGARFTVRLPLPPAPTNS
jgi:signal transduction histidine kinase